MRPFFIGCGAVVALLLGWEWISSSSGTVGLLFPPPSKILFRLWEKRDRFLLHTVMTLLEMVIALVIAFCAAFPVGIVMHRWKGMRETLQPLFVIVQCIPMFVLAPIMILLLDWSFLAIVIPTALMIFFPLTLSIFRGLFAVPYEHKEYFQLQGATQWQTFWKLEFLWALPSISAGIRIATSIAGVCAIAGEWAGAEYGLGILMLESRRSFDLESLYGGLMCLIVLSFVLFLCTLGLERRMDWTWKRGRRGIHALSWVVMGSLLFSSCQPSGMKEGTSRVVLDWFPNPNHIPLYVGLEKKFFCEEGIDLHIRKMADPGNTLTHLLSGEADIAVTYMSHTLRAMKNGAPIRIIGILIDRPLGAILYRKELGISHPEDLNGKKMGYCVDAYGVSYIANMLKEKGVEPSLFVNVGFDLVGALATKKVDAVYGGYWNFEMAQCEKLGLSIDYFTHQEFGIPSYHELIFVVHEDQQEGVEGFQRAMQKSIDYSRDHPEEAFSIYCAKNPDKSKETLEWERVCWEKTLSTLPWQQDLSESLCQEYASWMEEHHLL